MDQTQRRALFDTLPNPNRALDYIITLKATNLDGSINIQVRYVPDRLILAAHSFSSYISLLLDGATQPIEQSATTLIEDIHDELVTRWINVSLEQDKKDSTQHSVVMEERQPQWDNPQLLQRLKSF